MADEAPGGLKVFIFGPARSGTSITYYAARDMFGLPGRGEGHVFPIFQRIQHQYFVYAKGFQDNKGTLARELNPREFKLHMQEYIRSFYRKTYKGDSFVDKTPGAEAIQGANFILEVYPDARLIVTRRTGIEVVQSFRLKFAAGFEDACRAWTNCMAATLRMRERCPQILEIDQFDLTNAPEDVAARLCNHVRRPEKTAELARYFSEQRTDKSSEHDWRHRLTLAGTSWTKEEKETFRKLCGATMQTFGYPM